MLKEDISALCKLTILTTVIFKIVIASGGPFDVAILCDQSTTMRKLISNHVNGQHFYSKLANFVTNFIESNEDGSVSSHYSVVPCGMNDTVRLLFTNISDVKSNLLECNSANSAIWWKNYVFGDGLVEYDNYTSYVARLVRRSSQIIYFYIEPGLSLTGKDAFFNYYFPVLIDITGDPWKVILWNDFDLNATYIDFLYGVCYRKVYTTSCYVDRSDSDWMCKRKVVARLRPPLGVRCHLLNTSSVPKSYVKCSEMDCDCDEMYPWQIKKNCSAIECNKTNFIGFERTVPQDSHCPDRKTVPCQAALCSTTAQPTTMPPTSVSTKTVFVAVIIGCLFAAALVVFLLVYAVKKDKRRLPPSSAVAKTDNEDSSRSDSETFGSSSRFGKWQAVDVTRNELAYR